MQFIMGELKEVSGSAVRPVYAVTSILPFILEMDRPGSSITVPPCATSMRRCELTCIII